MTSNKIIPLEEMAARCRELQGQSQRVVLCHGTFDLMHAGHIRHLQRARQEGDVLMVTVTGDAYVNKGPGRPVFSEQLRAENLAALACVDYVAINSSATAIEALHTIQPSIYAKGSDYRSHSADVTGNIAREQVAAEAHGGQVFYTDEITFSSSSLLNEHFGVFPPETREYLKAFPGAVVRQGCAPHDPVSGRVARSGRGRCHHRPVPLHGASRPDRQRATSSPYATNRRSSSPAAPSPWPITWPASPAM